MEASGSSTGLPGAISAEANVELNVADAESDHDTPTSSRPVSSAWRPNLADNFVAKKASEEDLSQYPKKLRRYYMYQNQIIERFVQTDSLMRGTAAADDDEKVGKAVRFVINLSMGANVLICSLKLFAAVWSGSLAVIGSAMESLLDLVSGSIIFITSRMMRKTNLRKYPVGKSRLEPLGIVVFSAVMGMASVQLLLQAITTLSNGESTPQVDAVAYAVLGTTIAMKGTLAFLCWKLRKHSASAGALATDHMNDVRTDIAAIITITLAHRFPSVWWLDPCTAIGISLVILWTWVQTGKEHIIALSARVPEPGVIAQLTYLALNHDQRIKQIDTVRAYHVGEKVWAEVDIVLPEEMALREAHDIGEALQKQIEGTDFVERAFVHLDYETEHRAEHEHPGIST